MRALLSIAIVVVFTVALAGAAELYVCFDGTDNGKMDSSSAVCVPGSVSEIEVDNLDFSMPFQSGVPGGGITTPTKSPVKPKSEAKPEKKKGKTTENPFEKVFKTSEPK